MAAYGGKTVSIPLELQTVRKLAQLFRGGLGGVGLVADACNNIDARARRSLSDACNNIDARNLKMLADACNNIDSSNLRALADACNNIDAQQLRLVADACNNIDVRQLAASSATLDTASLNDIATRFESAAGDQ